MSADSTANDFLAQAYEIRAGEKPSADALDALELVLDVVVRTDAAWPAASKRPRPILADYAYRIINTLAHHKY